MAQPVTMTFNTQAFNGFLRRVNKTVATRADQEVQFAAESANYEILAGTPIDTGDFKSAWTPAARIATLHWSAGSNNSVQAFALEYGSIPGSAPWPNVGPRTVRGGGPIGEGFSDAAPNIYSSQAPIGMVRRALAAQAPVFRKMMLALVRESWS